MAIKFNNNKTQGKRKKSTGRLINRILFILSVIVLFLLSFYVFSSFVPFLIAIPILIVYMTIIIFPTAISLGIIWVSDGYRNVVHKFENVLSSVFSNSSNAITYFQNAFPIFASIGIIIVVAYFTFNLISLVKKRRDGINHKRNTVVSGIILFLSILFLILDFSLFN